MEMDFRDDNRRGRVIVVIGLILAVVAGGSAFFLISRAQQEAGAGSVQTVPVVVALRQIPARKAIEAGDIEVRQVPIDPTNQSGIFSDATKVIGLIPGVTILAGQPIYTNLLASQSLGGQYSILGPGETLAPDSPLWRAVSVSVPDERAAGGSIGAKDHVDIFLTATVLVSQDLLDAGKFYSDRATNVVYQDVEVLSKSGLNYIVKVPLAVAEEISHLQATGQTLFSLALRPAEDTRTVDASRLGETTNLIIQRYGLPVPEVYPAASGSPATPRPTVAPSPTPKASPAAP
jgi:Flp pilus assembly protein CpaB